MKTTWSIVLFLLLLAAPAAVQAQFHYTTNAGGTNVTVTGYTGPPWDVTIPTTNDTGLPVTSIGDNAFIGRSLTSVVIPGTITKIGQDAFFLCTHLASVTISNGVASIGTSAFSVCTSLTSVAIPGSVTNIGVGAFTDCASLTNATMTNGVTIYPRISKST